MLSFEDADILGGGNIVKHLHDLPFKQVLHKVTSLSVQPSGVPGALIVSVQGDLQIDGDESTLKFSQVWHLLPEGNSYWVHNDLFRLNYG